MCAMLSLILPQELKIAKSRVARFVEAYIGSCTFYLVAVLALTEASEILTRLRLHTCAAYIRKFATVDAVRVTTSVSFYLDHNFDAIAESLHGQMSTVIYTVCRKCRKPLLRPAGPVVHAGRPGGSFAYCLQCHNSITKCAIW